eukprot:10501252-Karenia_brevis.AAC.1
MQGQLECSYQLADKCFQMHEDNALKYLQWNELTLREQEISGVKKDKELVTDPMGVVRSRDRERELVADVSTDLLLRFALQRRGFGI